MHNEIGRIKESVFGASQVSLLLIVSECMTMIASDCIKESVFGASQLRPVTADC